MERVGAGMLLSSHAMFIPGHQEFFNPELFISSASSKPDAAPGNMWRGLLRTSLK